MGKLFAEDLGIDLNVTELRFTTSKMASQLKSANNTSCEISKCFKTGFLMFQSKHSV